MSWDPESVLLLIQEVGKQELIFNFSNPFYKNAFARKKVFDHIAAVLAPKRPGTTGEEVKHKWNTLRSTYVQERRKILESKKSGLGTDNVYSPTLYYFKYMDFLVPCITEKDTLSSQQPKKCLVKRSSSPSLSSSSSAPPSPLRVDDNGGDFVGHGDINVSVCDSASAPGSSSCTTIRLKDIPSSLIDTRILNVPGSSRDTMEEDTADNLSTISRRTSSVLSQHVRGVSPKRRKISVEESLNSSLEKAANILDHLSQMQEEDFITTYVKHLANKLRKLTEDELLEVQHVIDNALYDIVKKRKQ